MERFEITLSRGHDDGNRTIGILAVDDKFYTTLEDTFREEKVKGKTRIPAGRYEIKFREVESRLTKHYRNKYKWFKWHLELQNVPDFNYVYIHIGNFSKDTDGCILVGSGLNNASPDMILQSTPAFKELYEIISEKLKDHKVWITIKD